MLTFTIGFLVFLVSALAAVVDCRSVQEQSTARLRRGAPVSRTRPIRLATATPVELLLATAYAQDPRGAERLVGRDLRVRAKAKARVRVRVRSQQREAA